VGLSGGDIKLGTFRMEGHRYLPASYVSQEDTPPIPGRIRQPRALHVDVGHTAVLVGLQRAPTVPLQPQQEVYRTPHASCALLEHPQQGSGCYPKVGSVGSEHADK